MSLYTLKTNDFTQWSTFIKSMLYKMYILGVLINDLACLFNHKCLILLHMSLYTLRVNDLTRWTACINSMLYWIYIYNIYTYWVFVWIISTVLSIISVLSYFACPYTHWKQMILLTYDYHVISVYIFYDSMNDINSIVKCNCDMLIDKSLYTLKAKDLAPLSTFEQQYIMFDVQIA